MGVSLFYLLSLIPIAIGAFLWYRDSEVVWWEWLCGAAVAIVTAALFHGIAVWGMGDDIETWSGQIVKSTHYPRWVEQYQEAHTRTVGSGKNEHTETYYTTEYRTHPEYWDAVTQYDGHEVSEGFFEEICRNFANYTVEKPWKMGFYSGDPHTYVSYNKTGFIYPATSLHHWQNRTKAAPSVFSFAKVPTNAPVFSWPRNDDWRRSGRLLGTAAAQFDLLAFDRMNARLGPTRKVNVIMVGFDMGSIELAHTQEAKWLGGKKNDLVLCYGGMSRNQPASWAYVFGWSESFLAKRNLESLLLRYPASPQLLQLVEQEVQKNYRIKDWSKFDYITIEPPTWSYVVFVFVLIGSQTGLYVYFHCNEFEKVIAAADHCHGHYRY